MLNWLRFQGWQRGNADRQVCLGGPLVANRAKT
nr:MAG TPA: hypothetical protein [Caudoviricetes sp.]